MASCLREGGATMVICTALLTVPYDKDTPGFFIHCYDDLYVALVLYLMAEELEDMCAVQLLSSSAFFVYWPLLNIIDGVSIVLGLTSFVRWDLCIFAVRHLAVQYPARS